MAKTEIVLAALILSAAVVCLGYLLFAEHSTSIALGAAALLGAGGGFLLATGIHDVFAGFSAKHQAIYRDVSAQGFKIRDDDVFSRSGRNLTGTEVDVRAGGCVWPFYATKIDGTWRLTLDAGDAAKVIRSSAVADLAAACSR